MPMLAQVITMIKVTAVLFSLIIPLFGVITVQSLVAPITPSSTTFDVIRRNSRTSSTQQYISQNDNQQQEEQDDDDSEYCNNKNNNKEENYSDSDSLSSSSSSSSMFSMASLNNRLKEVKEKESKLPLVVLDSMLPRQVLELEVNNALLIKLVRDCITREKPYIGMLGLARLQTGETIHLTKGVEVIIVEDKLQSIAPSVEGNNRGGGGGGIKMTFKATGRRFEIEKEEGSVDTAAGGGWTEAKVQFLDSQQEEEDEINNYRNNGSEDEDEDKNGDRNDENDEYNRMAVARAITKSNEFTNPNMNMPNNLSLVDRWIELAKEKERTPGQIDTLLKVLGKIPPTDQPTERAFWIGALINPLPAMGVALEIRPALLTAKKAEQRVEIALNGIHRSIKYMDGSSAGLV
jgi:hypothetical protein